MTATALWTSVVANYPAQSLVTMTNPFDPSATTINTAYGETAAQEVIDLWTVMGQEAYDANDVAHVAVGRRGTIAVLFERGGTSSEIGQVEWNEVFGDDGLITKVKRTGPRGRQAPSSNSGVDQKSELTSSGRKVRGWSDPESLPHGRRFMPRRVSTDD